MRAARPLPLPRRDNAVLDFLIAAVLVTPFAGKVETGSRMTAAVCNRLAGVVLLRGLPRLDVAIAGVFVLGCSLTFWSGPLVGTVAGCLRGLPRLLGVGCRAGAGVVLAVDVSSALRRRRRRFTEKSRCLAVGW